EVRELDVAAQRALEVESAFFEDARGRAVVGVADGVEPLDSNGSREIDHGCQRLGGIAAPPCVAREDVPRRGAQRRLERKPGTAEERSVGPREREVRPCRPLRPLSVAELDEAERIENRRL